MTPVIGHAVPFHLGPTPNFRQMSKADRLAVSFRQEVNDITVVHPFGWFGWSLFLLGLGFAGGLQSSLGGNSGR